jgi:potassium-dependent mechanosensitive channel
MIRTNLCLIFIVAFGWGEIRAQSLQKLLEAGSGALPGQKAQPSAAEQKDWASERLAEFQAKEKALNLAELREELRKANLPETRIDEFLAASQEIIRNYQVAIDTLAAIIKRESQKTDPASPEPIPVPKDDAEVDTLRDKLSTLREQAQTLATQMQLDNEFLARERSKLQATGREVRRLQEEFDTADTDVERNRAAIQLRLAEIQQQGASSAVFFGSWRLYADQLDARASQAEIRAIEQALSASGLDSVFSEKRALAAIQQTEKQKASVQKQIASAQSVRENLDETIAGLEQELQRAADEGERKRIEVRLDMAREARELANRTAVGAQAWSAALDESLRVGKTMLSVAQNPSHEAYVNARKQAEQLLAQGDPWREQIRRYLQDARGRLDELEAQPGSTDPASAKLEEQRLDLARQRVAQLRNVSTLFETLLGHAEQLREESNQLLARSSYSERFTQRVTELGKKMANLWNLELFTTQEKTIGEDGSIATRMRGISVGKIVLGVIGLAAGVFIARRLARILTDNLSRRHGVETARAAFLEKVLFYLFLVFVVFTTLNWLRIPLTAFAFLGGALAIGIGFGAQTLMNNFISGLILLAEQRIKVGDVIEADGHLGRVMNLGTRCSRVRKFDGVDVLVPNSYLLEKNVINWTLSDAHHRYDFLIRVSNGASTELAMSTLYRSLEDQPEVLKAPKASVIFEALGGNALNFHLYYWLDIRRSDANKVGSEIRLRIDRLCREAGIEIV